MRDTKQDVYRLELNRGALVREIRFLFVVQQRRDFFIDADVVSVEPVDLVLGHERHLNEGCVVETEGECFEGEPLVFSGRGFGGFCRNDRDEVLRADAPFVGAVDTGFIGDDMTDLEGRGVIVRAHVLRSFVATEEMTDAMTRSVTVGDACFPHELLGECVQLVSARTSREACPSECDMSFKDISVV